MKVRKLFIIVFWATILAVSSYFYYDNAIVYLFGYRSERFGQSLFENQIWFISHIIGASFSLFLGPFQFWGTIRNKYIGYHRLAGKLYIIGSLVAGVSALRLSIINDCLGCRYSLTLLSVLFLLTTSLAWITIRKKNIVAHKQFMTRSYTCAMAFVFVRLNQIIPMDFLYYPINDPVIQRTVNEWMFTFVPIIAVEIFMIWIPSIKKNNPQPYPAGRK
ncbi:MAG: DUF2306 domain-containing protein [Bacteroidales bacterium]|nr:DUF2306 domain-containing protein [Bacteroidales bacterium]